MEYKLRLTVLSFLLIGLFSFSESFAEEFQKDARIAEIRPAKPVRIELKRDVKGAYTWELSGSDVQEIIKADVALRRYMRNPDRPANESRDGNQKTR